MIKEILTNIIRQTKTTTELDCMDAENGEVLSTEAVGTQLAVIPETPSGDFAASICNEEMDEYDMAVETDTPAKSRRNPVLHRKTLKISDSQGHTLHVWITEGDDEIRNINVIQKYGNGDFSSVLTMKQADVVLSAMSELSEDTELQKDVKRFMVSIGKSYMNRFRGMKGDLLSVQKMVDMIATELQHIPVYHDDMMEVERAEFYRQCAGIVKTLSSQVMNDHKSYYPLIKGDLEYVARNMGLDKRKMLNKLKKYDLLYLTPSSQGYQTNVQFNNGTDGKRFSEWCYCIIKNSELENENEYDSYNF